MRYSFRDVIKLWPTPDVLADEIGVKRGTAQKWRFRNWIPADKWMAVIAAAKARGETLTTDEMAEIAARKSERDAAPQHEEVAAAE